MYRRTSAVAAPPPEAVDRLNKMITALKNKQDHIFQMAVNKGFEPYEAQDIYQDVCHACIEMSQKKVIEIAEAYVQTVARNLIANALEDRTMHQNRFVSLEDQQVVECVSYMTAVPGIVIDRQRDARLKIQVALSDAKTILSSKEYEVFILCHKEGFSMEQAATELGLSYEAVRQRMSRATRKMKQYRRF